MKGMTRSRCNGVALRRTIFACLAAFVLPAAASGAAQETISVTELLKTGWQIAGYIHAFDNRSTFILFRHPDETHLVQCRVGYYVTRNPSVYSICYELR
jgi:hypothetical protein